MIESTTTSGGFACSGLIPRRPDLLNVAIDLATIANGQDPHDQLSVLDGVDDAVVADPQPPTGTVPLEGLDVERRDTPASIAFWSSAGGTESAGPPGVKA
jgi:hypothetical protein